MPIISVALEVERFRRTLDDLGRRQLPFASALALNQTARLAAQNLTRALPEIFSRPTPFTMRAIGVTGARKNNLRAEVFVKRAQARYLAIEETGGTRERKPGAPILTPVDLARNAYGNIPRGALRKLLADPRRYFLGRVRGVYGLWERTGRGRTRGVKLLVGLRPRATWRPRFGFRRHVAATVRARLPAALAEAMRRAIATAR